MNCTRCNGTGFLNLHQLDDKEDAPDITDHEEVLQWIYDYKGHDVQVCDCCGDGEDSWHGSPGEHYGPDDPEGSNGPYAYNGGLCECH